MLIARRTLLLAAAAATGCTAKRSGEAPAFPRYASDWTLETGPDPTEGVSGSEGAWVARYSGKPPVRVTVFRMPSQTGAFAQVQNWRAEPNKLAFYEGRYFGIVEGDGATHAVLNRVANAIKDGLPE